VNGRKGSLTRSIRTRKRSSSRCGQMARCAPFAFIPFLFIYPTDPQKMTYCFHSMQPGTPLQQRHVKQVIEKWEKRYTNVHFDHVDQDAAIRITFNSSDNSWSLTGFDIEKSSLSDPTMNLGGIDDTIDISKMNEIKIQRKFCFCLGLEDPGRGLAICVGLHFCRPLSPRSRGTELSQNPGSNP
jgi:hypothetical protein